MKSLFVRTIRCGVLLFCVIGLCVLNGCSTQKKDATDKTVGLAPSKDIKAILDYFPAGSIDSVARANQVIEVVKVEKKNIDARFYNDKLVCNKNFFVYDCYEGAVAQKKADTHYLQMLHTEAKRYIRTAEVRDRDYARDNRAIKEHATAEQRAANVKRHKALVKRVQERQAKVEAAARGESLTPNEKHSGNLMTPQEKLQNIEDFEAKLEQYESHQQRVEHKKAETQKKREQHEANQAAGKTKKVF